MSLIALEDLSVVVGDFRLDRITIEAGDGEYLVLLGPSGAGKTVLLEVIAGLRAPDTGTVTVNRQDMDDVPPEHRGIGLVYQDYSLFPHMTAAENIAYGLKLQKRPVQAIHRAGGHPACRTGDFFIKRPLPGFDEWRGAAAGRDCPCPCDRPLGTPAGRAVCFTRSPEPR